MNPGAPPDATTRIRAEALGLFARVGFGSTTVDDIAEAAEVGVATIYRRWADKAELANDLFSGFIDDFETLAHRPDGPTPKRRFFRMWDDIWAFAHEDPQRFIFVEAHTHEAWISPANRARKEELAAQNADILEYVGVRASADLAHAMTIGTLTAILRSGTAADKDDVGERIWQALRSA
ncbi:MAG: TetR/AcrR family transcriptional regulator [Actinomycetota bacterium]